jgi:hypothetical protein
MEINFKKFERREPITSQLVIPNSENQVDRYRRIQSELEQKNIKLHDMTRDLLDNFMGEIELRLAQGKL